MACEPGYYVRQSSLTNKVNAPPVAPLLPPPPNIPCKDGADKIRKRALLLAYPRRLTVI